METQVGKIQRVVSAVQTGQTEILEWSRRGTRLSSLKAQNKDSKSLVQKRRAKKNMRQGKSEQKVKGMRKL